MKNNDSIDAILRIDSILFNEKKSDCEKRLSTKSYVELYSHVLTYWFKSKESVEESLSEEKAGYLLQRLLHRNRKKLKSVAMALEADVVGDFNTALDTLEKAPDVQEDTTSNNTLTPIEETQTEELPMAAQSIKDKLGDALNKGGTQQQDGGNEGKIDLTGQGNTGGLPLMDVDNASIAESVQKALKENEAATKAYTAGHTVTGLLVKKRGVSERLTTEKTSQMIEIPYEKLSEMRDSMIDRTGAVFTYPEADTEADPTATSGLAVVSELTKAPAGELANVQKILRLLDEAIKNVDKPFVTKMYIADPTRPIVGFALAESGSADPALYTRDEMQVVLVNDTEGFLESGNSSVQVAIRLLKGKTAKNKREKLEEAASAGSTISQSDALKAVTSVGVLTTDKESKESLMIFMSEVSATETVTDENQKSDLSFRYYGPSGRKNKKGVTIATTMRFVGRAISPLKKLEEPQEKYIEKFPVSPGLNATRTPEENKKALESAVAVVSGIAASLGIDMGEKSIIAKVGQLETAKEAAAVNSATEEV